MRFFFDYFGKIEIIEKEVSFFFSIFEQQSKKKKEIQIPFSYPFEKLFFSSHSFLFFRSLLLPLHSLSFSFFFLSFLFLFPFLFLLPFRCSKGANNSHSELQRDFLLLVLSIRRSSEHQFAKCESARRMACTMEIRREKEKKWIKSLQGFYILQCVENNKNKAPIEKRATGNQGIYVFFFFVGLWNSICKSLHFFVMSRNFRSIFEKVITSICNCSCKNSL